MLEDFRLRVFVTVAQQKSFTKAASMLRISQPAVSQNVSELEKMLGAQLFVRQKGSTELSDAGAVFLRHAQDILDRYMGLQQLFMPFRNRVVKVAASEDVFDYLTGHLLSDFLSVHPEISFELTLMADDADLRIGIGPQKENRGMLALNYHPSAIFSSTDLWKVLSEILQPGCK